MTPIDAEVERERQEAKSQGIEPRPIPLTTCAVGNEGVLVVGNSDGQVWVWARGQQVWQDLTRLATFQFASPVKTVTIDPEERHVVALADWQPNSCSRPGLPGQALQVWDLRLPIDARDIPVSKACFPNQAILGIGEMAIRDGDLHVPLVTARGTRWHECPGCAMTGETEEQILGRLEKAASYAAKAPLPTDDELYFRYGLRFH
jgi:hypothetical protein